MASLHGMQVARAPGSGPGPRVLAGRSPACEGGVPLEEDLLERPEGGRLAAVFLKPLGQLGDLPLEGGDALAGRGHRAPPARLSAHACAARRVGSGAGERSVTSGLSTVACQPLPSATRVTVSTRPPLYARHTLRSLVRAQGSSAGCWPAACRPGARLSRGLTGHRPASRRPWPW